MHGSDAAVLVPQDQALRKLSTSCCCNSGVVGRV
jgi:hypothetical protein